MTWPNALVLSVALVCLAYCSKTRTKIDCHDWTAEECIAFVESVQKLQEAPNDRD